MDTFSDMLLTALQTILVTAIPVVIPFVIRVLLVWAKHMSVRLENDKARFYFDELTRVVASAVAHTGQTYVDSIKSCSEFDVDAQKSALEKAKETAISSLTRDAVRFFEKSHGDLPVLLEAKIEEAVRTQKLASASAVAISKSPVVLL